MSIKRDLEETLQPVVYLSLSQIAKKMRNTRNLSDGSYHPVTAHKLEQAFEIPPRLSERLLGFFGKHSCSIDCVASCKHSEFFWTVVAIFSSDLAEEILEFLRTALHADALAIAKSWILEKILEPQTINRRAEISDFIAICCGAAKVVCRIVDEGNDVPWREIIKRPIDVAHETLRPKASRLPSKKASHPELFFSSLTKEQVASLQTAWTACGVTLNDTVEIRILIKVLKEESRKKSKKHREFFDKCVALITAMGGNCQRGNTNESDGLIHVSGCMHRGLKTLGTVVKFLCPNFEGNVGTQVVLGNVHARTLPDEVLDQLRVLYDKLQTKRSPLSIELNISGEAGQVIDRIDRSSFESFVSDLVTEVGPDWDDEWDDSEMHPIQYEDLLRWEDDAETTLLEDSMRKNMGKKDTSKSAKLALNRLTFSPVRGHGKI